MAEAEEFLKNYPPIKPPVRDGPPSKKRKYPVVDDEPPRTILFLGDERVGKTTFIRNYCEHMHDYYRCDTYRGTTCVFTQFCLYCERGEKLVPTLFLDLPAGLTAESRRDQYPKHVNLVVLCFAADDPTSLENVTRVWLPEFRRHLPASTHYRLLGLKIDTREEMARAGRIPVSDERGEQIHEEYGFSEDYSECSVVKDAQFARHCMDRLIAGLILNESSPRIV